MDGFVSASPYPHYHRKQGLKTRLFFGNGYRWQAALLVMASLLYGQPSLLICIPGKQNTIRIQKDFEEAIGTGKAMAFGRIKDLEAAIASSPGAGIIASGPFVRLLPGYTTVLSGKVGNEKGEKFLIVTAQKDLTKDVLPEKRIGMLDFLGKDRLVEFVKNEFGISVPVLQRVNKEEDLLTMLGIEAVDAVILPESQYKDLLLDTKLPLRIIATSARNVDLATLALPGHHEMSDVKKAVLRLPAAMLKEIGLTGWEER